MNLLTFKRKVGGGEGRQDAFNATFFFRFSLWSLTEGEGYRKKLTIKTSSPQPDLNVGFSPGVYLKPQTSRYLLLIRCCVYLLIITSYTYIDILVSHTVRASFRHIHYTIVDVIGVNYYTVGMATILCYKNTIGYFNLSYIFLVYEMWFSCVIKLKIPFFCDTDYLI